MMSDVLGCDEAARVSMPCNGTEPCVLGEAKRGLVVRDAGGGRRKGEGLTELIGRRINDMIVERRLKPGDPLPTEVELIDSFEVGRGVVREAIVRLRALGVVEVRHGHGMFVARLPVGLLQARLRRAMEDQGAQATLHGLELREILLVAAARMAASKGADIDGLEKAIVSLGSVPREGIGEALEIFHACLGQACGNPLVEQLLAGLGLILRGHDQSRREGIDRARLGTSLEAIVAAIRVGQADEGEQAVRRHLAEP